MDHISKTSAKQKTHFGEQTEYVTFTYTAQCFQCSGRSDSVALHKKTYVYRL